MNLLINCQSSIGTDQNVRVVRRDACRCRKGDLTHGLQANSADRQIACVVKRHAACGGRILYGQNIDVVIVAQNDVACTARLPNSQQICGDRPCGRLGDVSSRNQPHIGNSCIHLLIQCERTTCRNEDILTRRLDAIDSHDRDRWKIGDRANCQGIDIVVGN